MYSMGNDYPVIKENLKFIVLIENLDFTSGKNISLIYKPFFSK